MNTDPRLDILGAALADPSRARLICLLMEGRAFTNKELAAAAGIAPSTATAHLQKLQSAGLTRSRRSGRRVYHTIANAETARGLEQMAALTPRSHLRAVTRATPSSAPGSEALFARRCYSHLAGRLGVALKDRWESQRLIECDQGAFRVTTEGRETFLRLGVSPVATSARACLDWTERRDHLSGPLATAFLRRCLEAGWLSRGDAPRALVLSDTGGEMMQEIFGLRDDV